MVFIFNFCLSQGSATADAPVDWFFPFVDIAGIEKSRQIP
jgi:hypothetical protein